VRILYTFPLLPSALLFLFPSSSLTAIGGSKIFFQKVVYSHQNYYTLHLIKFLTKFESLRMGQVDFSCCVAVVGSTMPLIAVLPIAIGTRARIVTTMLVFAWWRWLWREHSPKSELISGNLPCVH
jgi:hypothetical protein